MVFPNTCKLEVIGRVFIGCILFVVNAGVVNADRCLYVSSYNKGYEWNDGIENGIDTVLKGRCAIDKVYMESNENPSEVDAKRIALQISNYILETKPNIIIACDDSASKYLVKPYLKNIKTPVVFCGINWSVEAYGYPYRNVTGIIEVSPIGQLLDEIDNIVKKPRKGIYLSTDVYSEHKDYSQYRNKYSQEGILVDGVFVKSFDDWKKAFVEAQKTDTDFIILGNNAGISEWNVNDAMQFIQENSKKLSVSNYSWMMPYAMLGIAKLPEEQGTWAAKVALSILDGFPISNIPIVVNRQSEIYINSFLFSKANLSIPKNLERKAVSLDYQ